MNKNLGFDIESSIVHSITIMECERRQGSKDTKIQEHKNQNVNCVRLNYLQHQIKKQNFKSRMMLAAKEYNNT